MRGDDGGGVEAYSGSSATPPFDVDLDDVEVSVFENFSHSMIDKLADDANMCKRGWGRRLITYIYIYSALAVSEALPVLAPKFEKKNQ